MSNEGLEVEWNCLLSLVVPNLEEVVLTASKHVASVKGQVCASNCALVHGV